MAERKPAATDELTGVLERIIYANEENHYTIGELRHEEGQSCTVTGKLGGVQCGETLRLKGEWTRHPKHGKQFAIASFESTLPASVYGIRKYLGSGLIPGIGRHYAEKIVDKFGAETLKVISEESARLREVPGIGAQRAKSIKEAWDKQAAIREVMVFLQTYGVTNAHCLRLVKQYGNETIRILKHEPYRVAREVDYIGFKTADRIALNLGFPSDGEARLEAGLLHSVGEMEEEGHTCLSREELLVRAAELLDSPESELLPRLEKLCGQSSLRELPEALYQMPGTESAELRIAECLRRLAGCKSLLPPIKIEKAIEWAQEKAGFTFAEAQAEAIRASLANPVSLLTGGPGTGKTTILRALVSILQAKKVRVLLAAPTGRAAQRMSESTGAQARTLHRLLEFEPALGRFSVDEEKPLRAEFVIVDESSMLDTRLAASLIRAVPAGAHLLLVGDIHQLPSVGPGQVLRDLIDSTYFPVTRLDQIFRQQARSDIVTTAHAILGGDARAPTCVEDSRQLAADADLLFVRSDTPEGCVEEVCRILKESVGRLYQVNRVDDVQVLAPMHKGSGGIGALNEAIREALNGQGEEFRSGLNRFRVGDKVIQTRNDYDKNIFNGDIGRVQELRPEGAGLVVRFDSGPVELERADLGNLSPAWCISIHKSQGSEFPVVVIPLLRQHYIMLQRNLVYTAITRARRKVILVGDPSAWSMAVRNQASLERRTDLVRKLNRAFAG